MTNHQIALLSCYAFVGFGMSEYFNANDLLTVFNTIAAATGGFFLEKHGSNLKIKLKNSSIPKHGL